MFGSIGPVGGLARRWGICNPWVRVLILMIDAYFDVMLS
jgi:hypothetical protein